MPQGLADMFGVTTDEVNDMVTAGKVGFPEVQKVIENLTNEGGKFYNLMEEQSKTIGGKISNLGDAIDVMFNKIGQSQEGAINTVLDSTKYLIEHYEEIGRVLAVLISSYGLYRGAIIAYAVTQKMAVSAGNIKAFFDLAKGIKTAKDAQVALNLAMGANPLIKLASILMTVGGLIWAFARNSEDATEEVTGLNKALKDAGAEFEKESAKVQALQDVMNNSKVAYDERKRALSELKSIIPGYNAELNNEGILINNNTEAIKQYLVQLERQIKLKAVKEELEEAYKQKFLLEKDYDTKYKDWSSKNTNSAYHEKPIIDVVGMFGGRDLQKAEKAKDEAKQKLNEVEATISNLNSEIEKTADNTGGATNGVKSFAEQLQAAAVKVSTLKTQLADLKAGKGNEPDFAKAITETGAELAEAEKKYNLLLGIDKKYLKEKESELEKVEKSFRDMQLKAANNLFDEETALKRKQITDKVKLIEFDRDTTIAAIEAEKQAYIELADAIGEKADTSIFDKRIEIVQTSAKVDISKEENNQVEEQKKTLGEILKEFETYQQKRERIKKEYDDKIALLDKNTQQAIIAEAQKQQIAALAELDNSVKGSTSVMTQLFADTSQASVAELRRIINEAKAMYDYISNTKAADITAMFGLSAEQLKKIKGSPEDLQALGDAIRKLKGETGEKSPFLKFGDDIKTAIDDIKKGKLGDEFDKDGKLVATSAENIGKGLTGIGSAVVTISPQIKQFGEDLSAIFGDSQIGEDIGILMDTLSGLGTAVGGVGKIMSGDIFGGVTSIVSGIASIFSMANAAAERHKKALEEIMNSKIAQQREYNLMLLEQNLLYEKGITVFGTDEYGKAINAVKNYKDALSQLGKAMEGTDEQKDAQKKKNYFLSRFFGVNDPKAALKEQYAGLASMQIVTGHKKTGLFGWGKGKDTYSSILSVYPELIDSQGKFDAKLAETIISTRKMDDTTKAALQNCIELSNQYEDAMQQVKDYLTDIFGELGGTMSDALADAFKNGTDAAEAFADSVSDMLENLAKQMVYSVTIAPLMEKAQKKMLAVMDDDTLTEEEKFKRQAEILSGLTKEAITQQDKANELYKIAQDTAAGQGVDIFQPDAKEREASKKGFSSMSQESADELNGRFTAIQGHTYGIFGILNSELRGTSESLIGLRNTSTGIADNMKILTANSAQMLQHLAGIETNTDKLHGIDANIAEMKQGVKSLKNSIDDISLKGIHIRR